MASEAVPGSIPAGLVHGSQATKPLSETFIGGNFLPPGGKPSAAAAAAKPNLQASVATLNKYLNDSGRPNQFRVDPASGGRTIQEINPASGAVIGEFSAAQFPELARSLGVSGVLVDSRA